MQKQKITLPASFFKNPFLNWKNASKHGTLAEDSSSVPSIYISQLTTVCNSTFKRIWCLWPLWAPMFWCTHPHRNTYICMFLNTYVSFKNNKSKKKIILKNKTQWSNGDTCLYSSTQETGRWVSKFKATQGYTEKSYFKKTNKKKGFICVPCQLPSFLSPWSLSSMFILSSQLTVLVFWSFLSILLSSCTWGPLWLYWTHPDNLSLHLCPWFRGTSIRYFLSGQSIDMFRESELCSGASSAYCVCSPQ